MLTRLTHWIETSQGERIDCGCSIHCTSVSCARFMGPTRARAQVVRGTMKKTSQSRAQVATRAARSRRQLQSCSRRAPRARPRVSTPLCASSTRVRVQRPSRPRGCWPIRTLGGCCEIARDQHENALDPIVGSPSGESQPIVNVRRSTGDYAASLEEWTVLTAASPDERLYWSNRGARVRHHTLFAR